MKPSSFFAKGEGVYTSLQNAFYLVGTDIDNKAKALAFILKRSLKKDQCKRFISWLLAMDILPDNKQLWVDTIFQIYNTYNEKINSLLSTNSNSPLAQLSQDEAFLLSSDLNRTLLKFHKFAETLNISKEVIETAFFHASRIFALIILSDPTFSYTQGCDRYVYSVFLLSCLFSEKHHLPIIFSEAMTFYLSIKLMNLSKITHYLMNPNRIQKHFEELDKKMMAVNSETMKKYQEFGQSSVHFALRWEILMFADEHDFNGLMLIWDQIIARRDYFSSYIQALCIAHFAQAPDGQLDKLQRFKNWDYKKLLYDADIAFKEANSIGNSWKAYALCAIAGAFLIGQVLFH